VWIGVHIKFTRQENLGVQTAIVINSFFMAAYGHVLQGLYKMAASSTDPERVVRDCGSFLGYAMLKSKQLEPISE